MIDVQDQHALHRAREHRIWHPFFTRRAEGHIEEIFHIRQIVLRIHERLASSVLVRHRGNRRQLGDQAERGNLTAFGVVDVNRVVVEGRQRADHTAHHGHRVRITPEAAVEARQLFMHHGVMRHSIGECIELRFVGQITIQHEIGGFEKAACLGQLFNRIASVLEYADVAVDIRDARTAACGGHETRVIGKHARLAIERAHVDDIRAFATAINRKVHGGLAVAK